MTLATDTNIDPSYDWTRGPDMTLGIISGLNDTLALGGRKGHPGGNDSHGSVIARHHQGFGKKKN